VVNRRGGRYALTAVGVVAAAGCGAHGLSASQRAQANAFCRGADRRTAAGGSPGRQFLTEANLEAILAEVDGLRQRGLDKPLAGAFRHADHAIADATDVERGPQDTLTEMVAAKSAAAHVGIHCSFGAQLFGE
jgi:hypothetical protein